MVFCFPLLERDIAVGVVLVVVALMVVAVVVVKAVVAVPGAWQERSVEAEGIIPCQMIKVWGETVSRSTRILTRVLQTTLKQGGEVVRGLEGREDYEDPWAEREADCDTGPSSA